MFALPLTIALAAPVATATSSLPAMPSAGLPAASGSTSASPSVKLVTPQTPEASASRPPTWLVEEDSRGWSVNWSQSTLTVKGLGQAPLAGTHAERIRRSRKLAQLDGWNLMARALQGLRLNGEFLVADVIAVQDDRRNRLDEGIRDATVVGETRFADGSTELSLQLPLVGHGGVASWLGQTATPSTVPLTGPVTGLILDARGSGMQPAFAARLEDERGNLLPGGALVVLYAHGEDGLQGWVGERPRTLRVKVARGTTRGNALLAPAEAETWRASWKPGMPVVIVL